jgi:hypothetical protein
MTARLLALICRPHAPARPRPNASTWVQATILRRVGPVPHLTGSLDCGLAFYRLFGITVRSLCGTGVGRDGTASVVAATRDGRQAQPARQAVPDRVQAAARVGRAARGLPRHRTARLRLPHAVAGGAGDAARAISGPPLADTPTLACAHVRAREETTHPGERRPQLATTAPGASTRPGVPTGETRVRARGGRAGTSSASTAVPGRCRPG